MHENSKFVGPVNILTPFARDPFSWVAQHTTLCLFKFYGSLFASLQKET